MKCTDPNRTESDGVYHDRVVRDRFSSIPGVVRSVPGDCYCLDCRQPIAAWWTGGHPKIIEPQK